MDAMVTARVPVEIKEQVTALLKENGSSPTELVNSAYEYYLEHRELPKKNLLEAGRRKLSREQKKKLAELLAATTVADTSLLDGRSLQEVIAEQRRDGYEALS